MPAGELREYVESELNVRTLETCSDPLRYSSLRAVPDFQALGKRLGKSMAAVGNAIKALPPQALLDFEASGTLSVEGHELTQGDIKVGLDHAHG